MISHLTLKVKYDYLQSSKERLKVEILPNRETPSKKFFHEHIFSSSTTGEEIRTVFFQRTLMVSRGCPVTTQHTPPKPPARKFFEPEVLLVCFFGPSTTFCSAIDSAMLTVAS